MSKQGYKTFKGGVHPPYNKELASGKAIARAPIPAELVIPLNQHIGAPNSPLVSPGDRVKVGQKIGETDAFVSAPTHSSVAGTVKAVEDIKNFTGQVVKSVIITADAEQPAFQSQPGRPLAELSPDDIRKLAKEAGLVGMGGAAFPTHVKLSPPKDKPVDTVIINACECEPFLTCDHRLMLERPADMVEGLKLFMKAVGAEKGVIGIEANKMDAVEKVRSAASAEANIEVEILEVKYPEGSEKQLISAVTGRKVPPGKLPAEVGCLVQNVGTAIAIFEMATMGKPLYERVLTVTGQGIKEPSNLLVKIGTPISALIEACGRFRRRTREAHHGRPDDWMGAGGADSLRGQGHVRCTGPVGGAGRRARGTRLRSLHQVHRGLPDGPDAQLHRGGDAERGLAESRALGSAGLLRVRVLLLYLPGLHTARNLRPQSKGRDSGPEKEIVEAMLSGK